MVFEDIIHRVHKMTHTNVTKNGGIKMKKNKFRVLKRLLRISLALVLVFAFASEESTLTAFASTEVEMTSEVKDDEIVIFDEDGTATYQTITTQDATSALSEEIVIVSDYDMSTCVKMEDNNEISPRASGITSIPDNMAVLSPYKYCCIISSRFPDGTTMQSSGILLGKDVVLTSAHGVYNHDHGGNSNSIIICVGAYYNSAGKLIVQQGTTNRKQLVMKRSWIDDQKDTSDWALIILEDKYILNSYPTYGYAPDYTKAVDRTIDLVGYPGEKFVFSQGKITGTTDYKWDDRYKGLWTTSASSSGGMSGGPMFDVQTGAIIGIVKGKSAPFLGSNVCTPITEDLSNIIKEYKYK